MQLLMNISVQLQLSYKVAVLFSVQMAYSLTLGKLDRQCRVYLSSRPQVSMVYRLITTRDVVKHEKNS